MPKIIYKNGDLLEGSEYFIAHGCNAQGVMNSGVARAIRERYPKAYQDYLEKNSRSGLYPGMVIPSQQKDRVVYNCITQKYYGRDPDTVYVSYDAIHDVIMTLNIHQKYVESPTIAFPLIGAGLANGDWNVISNIIETRALFQPVVYIL